MLYTPSNGVPTEAIVTISPAKYVCAAAVVIVATLFVRALLLIVAAIGLTVVAYSPTSPRSYVSAWFQYQQR